jgi:hypothetical protein
MNFILEDVWKVEGGRWKVESECVVRAKVAELMILLMPLIWYFIEEAVEIVSTLEAWTSSCSSLPQAESSARKRKTLG